MKLKETFLKLFFFARKTIALSICSTFPAASTHSNLSFSILITTYP